MTITLTQIEQIVKHWAAFVKAHERLLVITLSAALLFHFGEKGLNLWDKHLERQATIAQQRVNDDATKTKKTEQELAELRNQVAIATATAEQAKAEAHKKATDQINKDKNLAAQPLADRWTVVLNLKPNAVTPKTPAPDSDFSVTNEAAHLTVEELERIPDLTENVVQTTAELAGCRSVSAKQDEDITGLKKQLNDEHAARLADVKELKTAAHKSWIRGFKWGVGVGFGGAIALKVATKF